MEISESEQIILDSSVWIAYLHEEDSQHEKAIALVGRLSDSVIVPSDVLDEVATTLKNKKREDLAKGFVQEVLSGESPLLIVDENVVRQVAETFISRSGDRLSFTDTALLVLSQNYRVITFDRRLQKAMNKSRAGR